MRVALWKASVVVLLIWIAQSAAAQDFAARPVRFLVPFPPGGVADTLMCILADPLSKRWGKPVIVDNRPGGGTIISAGVP